MGIQHSKLKLSRVHLRPGTESGNEVAVLNQTIGQIKRKLPELIMKERRKP
jgi:hypothetical protein